METYAEYTANQSQAERETQPSRRLATRFFIFAGLQALIILAGAVVGLFIAPASLFVSQTSDEAAGWILVGLVAAVFGVLGVVLFILAIIAGLGIRKSNRWGRITGFITALIALLEFPIGTAFGVYALMMLMKGKGTSI